jgi:hypothetical protein
VPARGRPFGSYTARRRAFGSKGTLPSRNREQTASPGDLQGSNISLGRKAFRKLTWREGTGSKLSSRFCFVRVKTTHDDGIELSEREPLDRPLHEALLSEFVAVVLLD